MRKVVRTHFQCILLQETAERAVWANDSKRPRRISGEKDRDTLLRFCGVFWFTEPNRVRAEQNLAQGETSYCAVLRAV